MNIIFRKVRWKNLLSTGDIFTEIDLNRSKTTLISGTNGSGKSTLIEAIIFALYGKPFRKINKPQLINTINQKDMLVELEFTIGKINYLIRRGIKPNVFEIYRDGVINNKTNDQQDELERNILKMNYKSFTQIVILGSATYIPFMELTAKDRREIIEDLLDILIFSTMNLLLKEKVSDNKARVDDNKYRIELITTKIESAKENTDSIRRIREEEVKKVKDKIRHHVGVIEGETASLEELDAKIVEVLSTISDKDSVTRRIEKIRDIKSSLEAKSHTIEKDLHFYHDHDNCPTCRQEIDTSFKRNIIDEKTNQNTEIKEAFTQIVDKLGELSDRMTQIAHVEAELQKLYLISGEHRTQIRLSKNTLNECKIELEKAQQEVKQVDTSRVDEYNQELEGVRNQQQELYEERETLAVVGTMLKDSGIKTKIIKQYVPIMNKLINKYLAAFDLFVDFQLDENFNEVIKSRFRDTFSYASFSEGEKLRINLAIMLTWRAVAKLRNSVSSNLLLLDETLDGALDGFGIETLIDTLHHMNANDNIFVISHRGDLLGDKFESHIRFEKVKNFSTMALAN